jgi:exodeoxyribonuclease V gamma subunit
MKTPRLFTSNRVEHLVEALAEVLRRPLSSPLHQEVIVVQSKGMERYLSMQLARRLGIWANCRYPFPNAFVEELFRAVIPEGMKDSPFDSEVLTWRIMKELPSLIRGPGFETLGLYIEGEEDLKRLQLSAAVADTFDQYLLFRPEMIFRWEKGEEDHWQARLWRHLSQGLERHHRAARAREFVKRMQNPWESIGLPERVSVFGISALPRFHMETLAALSRFTEVNLFVMNPCIEYWGDLSSENPGLLSSLGRLGRDFLDLVIDLGWEDLSFFSEPGVDTLLHSIQSDILHLREAETKGGKRILSEGDRSVQFHVCHSPMREIEVLRDRILGMLEADPELKPGEVLVMTPDIRLYAPYIQAVFDIPQNDPTYIPFGIADQGVKEEGRVIGPFLSILDLAGSRFGASQVLGILEGHSVCRKFGLEERELEMVRRWIKETRIRWGMDDQAREDAGMDRFAENTWRAGLDRLLLGYAMHGGNERIFRDILPYDSIEGSEASVLGRFVDFIETLFEWVKPLEDRRRLGEWSELLLKGIEKFFDPEGETEKEIRLLKKAIGGLGRMEGPERAGYDGLIDLKSIRWHLARNLGKEGFGTGFLTGGITFCAMLPMRSIPFKVLGLVGMNSDAYPRESHAPGFDLISKQPRPGDRSRRNDDRYLFLESILSARETLYISYVGRSIQDNSVIPPSVLVSELKDYIDQGFQGSHDGISDRLVTVHGLQAFSPRYFRGKEGLFSYSEEHCAAARNLAGERTPPVPFISTGLSTPEMRFRSLDLSDLCSFYSNPSRFLLQKRLGVHLEEETPLPEDREPIEIKGLEKYKIEQTMVEWALRGRDLGHLLPVIKASGQIPPGRVGECLYEGLRTGVEKYIRKTAHYLRRDCLEDLTVDQRIAGFRLIGKIEGVNVADLVRYRYARLKGSDFLRTWILHLALNAFAPDNYPRTTLILGLEEKKGGECTLCRFSPVETGEALLGELLDIYWEGLMSALHFFPESSWTYARCLNGIARGPQEAVRRARKTWSGSEWERGECEDPYYKICFGDRDPLDHEFEELSTRILQPLLEHMNQED